MRRLTILILALLFSCGANAFNCTTSSPLNYTVPLSGATISVGSDMPNGSVIYKGIIQQSSTPTYTCDAGTQWLDQQILTILSSPSPLASWSGSPFPGAVYNTNIPGVGIAIWSQLVPASAATMANPVLVWSGTRLNTVNIPIYLTLGYSLIKLGNIQAGAINAASLPSFGISLQVTPNAVNFPWQATIFNFSGTINIVTNTCQTPDVDVNLGAFDTSYFTVVGKTTPWVKSNIKLTNCPQFSGYFSTNAVSNSTNGSSSVPGRDMNALSVSITPGTLVINAANGIMNVTSNTSSASGIGIQLGWGDASATPAPYNFSNSYNYSPPTNGVSSFDIPLAARYIQTSSTVSPGVADATATFMISYY